MDIRWPKTIRYTELWEATGEKPIILQIGMRKWRLICHTSRKGAESTEKQALDWNPLGARRRGKRPFWRKQEIEAKHAVRLYKSLTSKRVNEGASQVPCVPNGGEGYTVTV